jgi:hypothetical protein
LDTTLLVARAKKKKPTTKGMLSLGRFSFYFRPSAKF